MDAIVKVELFFGRKCLESLKDSWDYLYSLQSKPHVEQAWSWACSLTEQMFQDNLVVVGIRSGEQQVAFLPLMHIVRKVGPFKFGVVKSLANAKFVVLADILIHPDWAQVDLLGKVLPALAQAPSIKFDCLEFEGFLTNSALYQQPLVQARLLQAENKNAFFNCRTPEDLKSLSKKHLKNIERLSKQLAARNGELVLECATHPLSTDDFADFIRLEDSGWKGQLGTATSLLASGDASFYEQLIRRMEVSESAQIFFLKAGQQRIATALGLRAGRCWYLHKIGYDQQVSEFGPGNILLLHLVRYFSESSVVDKLNLVTCPKWSERWHLETQPTWHFSLYGSSLRAKFLQLWRYYKNRL